MKLFDHRRARVAPDAPRTDGKIYDRDRDGRPMYERDVVTFVHDEWKRRRDERRPYEAQWTLNANFLAGNQHCGIRPHTFEVEEYEAERDYMEHGVFNRIAPLIETRLANLKTVSYAMTVSPRTGEIDDCEKSDVSTKLLRYTQNVTDFASQKNRMLLWSELCGSAFVLSWWDPEAGDVIADVDGKPVASGALAYGVLTPFEVFPDSLTSPDVASERSILVCQVKTTEEVFDLYGIEVKGTNCETYSLVPTGRGNYYGEYASPFTMNVKEARDSVYVMTYFERPSARHPRGRLIVTAGDRLVFYGDMPYEDIPLVMLRAKEVPGCFFGKSVIEELIPLQRAYNGTKNKIHDFIRSAAANPLLVPEGSIGDIVSFADRGLPPGEIVEYDPSCGKPESLVPVSLSSEIRYECEKLASDMEYVAGVSSLMVYGRTPSGVTSGTAIESLRAIDNTRLSLSGENLRSAVRALAVVWLQLYKRCASGYHALVITGEDDAGEVLTWSAEDINSFDIAFDAENELATSSAMQKETFLNALSLGLLTGEDGKLSRDVRRRALEMMKIGRYSDLLGEEELHIKRARREGTMLLHGKLPAVGALDDHTVHLAEHRRFALEMRYDSLRASRPDLVRAFDAHMAEHAAILAAKEARADGGIA